MPHWEPIRIGERTFGPPGPYVVGVLNVTPDSFSDGGLFLGTREAVAQALRLAAEGADLLDVGGESTRPGATPVSAEEEISRVLPVLESLAGAGFPLPISIDTRKVEVARRALGAGAAMVNDVQGLCDPALAELVAGEGIPVVLMHMRGTPSDMRSHAQYRDVVDDVRRELEAALERAEALGVDRRRIVLDPGLGFAKTAEQSLEVLARLGELHALGRPLYIGPSRKSFLGATTGAPVEERLPATLAAVSAAVLAGAAFVRVHDVAAARQAARVAAAVREAGRDAPVG